MISTAFVISSVSSFDFSNFGQRDFTKYPSSVHIETLKTYDSDIVTEYRKVLISSAKSTK